jgi:hypothetical protein
MDKNAHTPLNPMEARDVKAAVYDLSEVSAKQLLYGVIQILSLKNSIIKEQFLEILDDAKKYSEGKWKPV